MGMPIFLFLLEKGSIEKKKGGREFKLAWEGFIKKIVI
jgi:hypothetical protein